MTEVPSRPKIVVWKDPDPSERRPWLVCFLDLARPGAELYRPREFKHWRSAVRWAFEVAEGTVSPIAPPGREQGT